MAGARLKLESPWSEVKERLKEHSIELTDEDLQYDEGNAEPMLEKLAAKLDKSPDDIRMLIESLSSNKGMAG